MVKLQYELFPLESTKKEFKEHLKEVALKSEEAERQFRLTKPTTAPEGTRLDIDIKDIEYIGDVPEHKCKLGIVYCPRYKITDKYGCTLLWTCAGKDIKIEAPCKVRLTVTGCEGNNRRVIHLKPIKEG